MPAASSKRSTPARKKAKLTPAEVDASVCNSLDTSTPLQAPVNSGGNGGDLAPPAEDSSKATRTPSRTKAKRIPAAESCIDPPSKPSTPALSTSASALKLPKPAPPKGVKGKGKAKAKVELDNAGFDLDEELFYGKNPDVEIFSQEGPLHSLNRLQLKTQKSRSLRTLWLQGVYHPPFFGIPSNHIASSVANEDVDTQPTEVRDRPIKTTMPWPGDGHVKTWLDSAAYPSIKKDLIGFWYGQVGWVPNQGIYDWAWFPGKAFGWAQNVERSKWARDARQALRQNPGATNEALSRGQRPGWPFVQSWLDMQLQNLNALTGKEAESFLRDTSTPQRSALQHPTTVMKSAVPELSMRNRLRKSVASDTPKKTPRVKSGAGGADAEMGAGDDDDAAGAADDDDDDTLATLDANQEPINPGDPKFANIPNLGFEEQGPVCGDVLHVSVGPPDQEVPVQIVKGASRRLDSLGVVPDEGHLLNAGGHVYAVDWAHVPVHLNTGKEYFVVSAAASKAPLTVIGGKQVRPAPASLQIWSVSPDSPASATSSSLSITEGKGEARLVMMLCHELGAAFKLAWCPIGHDFIGDGNSGKDSPRRLGLLAGCFADGSLSVFSVPHPEFAKSKQKTEPAHMRLDPILRFEHPQQAATSLAWAGGEMLAFGGSRGWIGVWNVGRILRSPSPTPITSPTPPPDYIVRAHRSSVTDLTFVLLPPIDSNGVARESASPNALFSTSLDGVHAYNDLTRGAAVSIERSRAVHYACAFSPFSGGSLVHENADGSVTHYSLRPEEMLRSRELSHTPSRVVSLASSAFHPMIAMGTAHGELKLANILRTLRRRQRNHLPVFQQFVNRSTGELVVRHHLQPEIATGAEHKSWHLAQWHPCLAVTCVRWNPNLGRARLVLSGTASGMVKVDFVKPPYEG